MQEAAGAGHLSGSLRVPDTAGSLNIRVDLRARQVVTSITLAAPTEGRASARVNWLLRQLGHELKDLRVEAAFANTRETTSLLASEAREFPQRLLHPSDPKRPPREFTVAVAWPMGLKRGKIQGSFVRETRRQVLDFYREIVQGLKAWQPPAPKLPEAPAEVPNTPQPEPPPFVAVDERDLGEARTPREDAEA